VQLEGGGRVLVAPQLVGGAQLQDRGQPQAEVSADGKFEVRLAPGTFRLAMFVNQGDDAPGAEPAFMTPDHTHSVGATITGNHGDELDVELKVWPRADIERMRSAQQAAYRAMASTESNPGSLEKGVLEFTRLLEQYPNNHSALIGRGIAYREMGKYGEAIADFQNALETYPRDVGALLYLATLLASCPDAEFRDGARAVQLASQLVKIVAERNRLQDRSQYLAVLAAAQAEAGDFDAAVDTQKDAVAVAADEQRAEMESRLKLFEAGKPYHHLAPMMR
jgi:tetratricopeptide (TPR) repeat protein